MVSENTTETMRIDSFFFFFFLREAISNVTVQGQTIIYTFQAQGEKSYEVQNRKSALHFALKGCSCYTPLSMCKQNKSSVRAYQL